MKKILALWSVLSVSMCVCAVGQTLQQRPRYTLHPGDRSISRCALRPSTISRSLSSPMATSM